MVAAGVLQIVHKTFGFRCTLGLFALGFAALPWTFRLDLRVHSRFLLLVVAAGVLGVVHKIFGSR